MRNFWIKGRLDGRKTEMTGGPRNKKGGFILDIYMRNNGSSFKAIQVVGHAKSDGELTILVDGIEYQRTKR